MQLLIVRHGECLGQTNPDFYNDPVSSLTPLGEKQSHLTGKRVQDTGITHIISSPLRRALATSSIITESVGNLPVYVWPELWEMQSYSYSGLNPTDIIRLFPRAVLPDQVSAEKWSYGNLTYDGVFDRCHQVLSDLQKQYRSNDCVLMVTHGGFANYFLHFILNVPASKPTWFEIGNCAISKIRFVPEPELERPNWPLYPPVQIELLSLNDSSHLRSL